MCSFEKINLGMKAQGIEDIEIRNLINIKEHKKWGYGDESPEQRSRKTLEEIVRYEKW